jgi:hypothetical protein
MLISPAIFDRLQRDTLQDKMQLINAYLHASGIQVKSWDFKSAFLQPPVKNGKPALLVDQHLQVRTGLVDEDEGVPLRHLPPQFTRDDAAKLVKPFAHIGLFAVKVIGPVIAQQDQAAHD